MYSKTMAQTVTEEPVEFEDADVAPERDGCPLTVDGFLENRLENLAALDNKEEEISLETLPDVFDNEGCGQTGVNDAVTDAEDFPEKAISLEEEGQIRRLRVDDATAVPSFSIAQAQCKSDEDDGYCSRSSLDSPVQTSQSDSEANDTEVFALKETSATFQPGPTGDQAKIQISMESGANCPDMLVSTTSINGTSRVTMPPAPAVGASSSLGSHSTGPQKILIVNKTANVKYLIPTTGEFKSAGSPKTLSIPSARSAQPPPASTQLPNLVNLKILKPGLNKFCPGQITLLRVPDKKTPGLPSATLTCPLTRQPSSARPLPRTDSFIAVPSGQLDSNSQPTEIDSSKVLQDTACVKAPLTLRYSTESGSNKTVTRPLTELPNEHGCLGNSEGRSEATRCSSVVIHQSSTCSLTAGGQALSISSCKAAAAADALEGSTVDNITDKSLLALYTRSVDDVAAAGENGSISSLPNVMRSNHETILRHSAGIGSGGLLRQNGTVAPAPGSVITCHAISRSSQVVVGSAGRDAGVSSLPKVDRFKKPFPMASFPLIATRSQDPFSTSKAPVASRSGPAVKGATGESDSQKILTACLSSTSFLEEGSHAGAMTKLAMNGQTTCVANKSSVYQLASRNNQDVTVILLPQTSLQSMPKKTNPANEATCKQVVLRIGPSQVFKAISVHADRTKSDEKPGKVSASEGTNGRDITNKKDLAAESFSRNPTQPNVMLNKAANLMAVVDRAAAGSKEAASSAKQLLTPEKEISSLPKSSTSIGRFASLSLPGLQVATPSGATDSSQHLTGAKPLPSSPAPSKSLAAQSKSQRGVAPTGAARARTGDGLGSGRSRLSRQGLRSIWKSCQSVGYLHPLIDHDYCEFSAFCADVQSSIISLTDSSIRPERRYVKKNRAARTKALRVSQYVSENCSAENRPKRKYCKRKQVLEAEAGKRHGALNSKFKAGGKGAASPGRGATGAVQSLTTSADDKDYVKIPGYYQDEYVYYATKRLPGRPRNRADASSKASDVAVSKPLATAPAGISMFDWYKEMAQTDKTSRFGAAEVADSTGRGSYLEEASTGKDCTPVDESDVADLVMDMLPSGDLVRPMSDDMKFMSSSGIVDSLLSNPLDMSMLATTSGGETSGDVDNTYLNLMAEEVRLMLSSMGEAELKLLESHLENEKITDDMHTDGLDINSYLGDYATHEANMSQSSVSNLLDVDDINDGDLLSADFTNMNIILNDLNATSRAQTTHDGTTAKLESGGIGSIFDKGVNGCDDFMGGMHDIGLGFTSDAQPVNSNKSFPRPDRFRLAIPGSDSGVEPSVPLPCDASSPPELTTINMFWNDLPGLLMNGKEFVRLVDIHKQIMPAKDTGILKKRCHMMGLHITNCSELQRDFLIRYMNAAKSKSTVIIAKDAAVMLIGFYVNPKSRSKGADEDFELDVLLPQPKLTKSSAPRARHQWSAVAGNLKQTGFPAAGSQPSSGSLSAGSDVGATTAPPPEKHICRAAIPQPSREGTSIGIGNDSEAGADVKRSERLRHKHISYADLIHGGIDDSDRRSGRLEGVQSTSAYGSALADEDRFNTRGSFSSSLSDGEHADLENLIREQKRRRLTLEEKLRLKLLRNCQKRSASIPSSKAELVLKGTRRRLLKRAKRTRRLLVWKRNRKMPSTASDLHTLEHCYAASPTQLTGGTSKHQNPAEHRHPRSSEQHVTRNSHASASSTPNSFTPPAQIPPKVSKSATVGVIHRDVTCRVNRRRRSQIGELVVNRYTSNDAPCIRCSNCREMLGVQQFLKHMHWRRGSDKLVRVTIAQKLHLQSSSRTPDNLAAWDEFQRKRGCFEGTPEVNHPETALDSVVQRTPATAKERSAVDDAAKSVRHPSTRHSSRISKRKLLHPVEKYVFANTNAHSDASAVPPGSEAKRRRLTTDVSDERQPSSVGGQQPVAVATGGHSKFPQRQSSSLLSVATREKGRARRRSVVPSDRLLRVTTRRTHDS